MKALKIARTVAVWLVVALAVFMMVFTAISVCTFDRADRKLFCYRAFVVLTDSMEKTDFAAGDLVLIKDVDPQTLKEGDIIAFTSRNEASYGKTITHKIRRLTTDADGIPGFVTYGTTTDTDDETVVTYPFVIGKYEGRVPKVGKFFQFLKSTPGYIVCIFIPFMVLILLEGARCVRLFRKYKSEQQAEMKAERDRLAAERAETQRMMKELLEMKEKLKESGVQPQTGETPPAQEPKM